MSYSYYKSRIETMQSNDVIDVAENLWQHRAKPTNSLEIMDGISHTKMDAIIRTLRIHHGFVITIKQILDVTYLQLVGFDQDVTVEGKLGRRQSCELTPSVNSKINEVFRDE